MSLDPRMFPPGTQMHAVPPRISPEAEEEMLRRAADEEAYKREQQEWNKRFQRSGRALEITINLTQHHLCEGGQGISQKTRDAAEKARLAALAVLASSMESL